MKFRNSVGPNPRVLRIFVAERGIEIPCVEIDRAAARTGGPPIW